MILNREFSPTDKVTAVLPKLWCLHMATYSKGPEKESFVNSTFDCKNVAALPCNTVVLEPQTHNHLRNNG